MKNQNNNNIKYFIYLRKSTEGEDRQVQSIERQLEEVQKIKTRSGLKIIETFSESRSAKIPHNRPAFTEMIERVQNGEANGILCWHINRLSRNPLESGIIQQLLADKKLLSIQTKDREYLPEDNHSVMSVESGMSSQYSRDLSKSVISGLEKKLNKGIAPISAPIGYLNTKFSEHGSNSIIVDPDRFLIIRKIWDTMLTGTLTPPKILELANNEWGLRTRKTKVRGNKKISRSSIYRILTDPFYAGMFYYRGKLYEGIHKPMITLDEFDKVQNLLGREGRPRPKQHTFSYTGLIRCSECGSAITACEKQKLIKTTGEMKKYTFYYCTRRKKGEKECTQKKVTPLSKLEDQILREIEKVSISNLFKELAFEVISENYSTIAEEQQAVYDPQLKELSNLERQIKNLFEMRLDGEVDESKYKEERDLREEKITLLKRKMREQEKGARKTIEETEDKFTRVTRLKERFQKGTLEEKKSIFIALGENHSMKSLNLFISKHKWIEPIERRKNSIQITLDSLEPEESLDEKRKKEAFNLLRPLMRSEWDLNPRPPP